MDLLRSVVLWGFVIFFQNVNSAVGSNFCYLYEGCNPPYWGGYCQTGTSQSPIDITATSSNFSSAGTTDLYFSSCYSESQAFTLTNNGHTAQAALSSDLTSTCTMTGGLLNNTYTFAQMHFHWGSTDDTGSEHTLNNASYVMEAHLVHYKSVYTSTDEAAASNETDALVVLGIFFELGTDDNSALEPIISALSSVTTYSTATTGSGLVLANFLTLTSAAEVPVVQYDGSLTTPNCNEAVLWNVFSEPLTISQTQLDAFRSILDNQSNALVDNDRPIQALNGRVMRYYYTSIVEG